MNKVIMISFLSILILIFGALVGIFLSIQQDHFPKEFYSTDANAIVLSTDDFKDLGLYELGEEFPEQFLEIGFEEETFVAQNFYIVSFNEFSTLVGKKIVNLKDLEEYLSKEEYEILSEETFFQATKNLDCSLKKPFSTPVCVEVSIFYDETQNKIEVSEFYFKEQIDNSNKEEVENE